MEPERNAKHEEIRQDLAQLLADILVEDYQQYPSIMGHTAKTPGGLNRKAPTVAKVRAELGDDGSVL